MISQFNQPHGSTSIEVNKQSIARNFGVKEDEVVYFTAGIDLGGFKVIYDESTQRAYSLPADIGSGVTAVSLSPAGVIRLAQSFNDVIATTELSESVAFIG